MGEVGTADIVVHGFNKGIRAKVTTDVGLDDFSTDAFSRNEVLGSSWGRISSVRAISRVSSIPNISKITRVTGVTGITRISAVPMVITARHVIEQAQAGGCNSPEN